MDSARAYAPTVDAAAWFERAPDAMAIVDFDGRIRRVNAAVVRYFGYLPDELIGSNLQRYFLPDDLPLIDAALGLMARGEPGLIVELRCIDSSGAIQWFEWNGAPLDAHSFIAIGRQISTRRALSHTLEDAGAAMAGLSQGYWVRDIASNTTYWSPELRAVFGIGPDRPPFALEEVCDLVHPDDRDRVRREIQQVLDSPSCRDFTTEYRLQSPEGMRVVRASVRIARDTAGRAVQTVGTAQDVTAQRRMEEGLAREQQLNRAIFESGGALIVVVDREGRVVRFNRAAEELTGLRREEVEGKPFWTMLPADEREYTLDAFRQLASGKVASLASMHWLGRDGARIPTTWSNTAVLDEHGQVRYVIATGMDVSRLAEARRQLALAREDYRRLIELTFDMVLVLGADGTILDINGAGAQMLGAQDPDPLIGRNGKEFVHPEFMDFCVACLESVLRDGEQRPHAEVRFLSLDGKVVDVEITAAIRVDWNGARAVQAVIRDLSEHRLAQTAERAREHYFETLAQVVNVGIYQSDVQGYLVYANRRAAEILGSEDLHGHFWQEYVHPEDLPRVDAAVAASTTDQPFVAEWRVRRPDGKLVWVLHQAAAQRGDQGELLGYIGTVTDITPFKELNNQLAEAEERARRVVAMSFDLVIIVRGEALTIAEINARGARMLGGRPSEFVDQPFLELVLPKHRGTEASRVRRALESGQPGTVAERKLLKRDGSYMDMEGAAIPVTYDGEPAVYVVYRDITQRKAAERALRQREHHFQTLAKAAPVGIFLNDVQSLCVYVNERYQEITGYPPVETLGQGWWAHMVDEDRERVHCEWKRLIDDDTCFRCEYRLRRNDGQVIWVLGQAVSERDSAGRVLGYVGTITDITRSKLNEIELRNYREHLEDMVRDRTLELEAVNRELESFSYSVSHDLRAPLRAIHGFVTTLADEYQDKLDDDARFFLHRIQVNSNQMSELIEDLLQLSKVSQAPLKREWVDLSELAAAIIEELRLAQPERQVQAELASGCGPSVIPSCCAACCTICSAMPGST
ncbi:MAG: PAS domain S-box protein, partial [Thiohalomonadaceae bacterium]